MSQSASWNGIPNGLPGQLKQKPGSGAFKSRRHHVVMDADWEVTLQRTRFPPCCCDVATPAAHVAELVRGEQV
jgi:hypothetical protein